MRFNSENYPLNLSSSLELSWRGLFCFSSIGERGEEKVSASFEIQLGDRSVMEGHDLKAREGQLEAKQQLREASDVNQNYA